MSATVLGVLLGGIGGLVILVGSTVLWILDSRTAGGGPSDARSRFLRLIRRATVTSTGLVLVMAGTWLVVRTPLWLIAAASLALFCLVIALVLMERHRLRAAESA